MEGDSKDRTTLYCGNLAPSVTEEILYELFLQAGPVEKVTIPKDKRGQSRSFGFITFKHEASVPYAFKLMSGEKLFGRNLRLQAKGCNVDEQFTSDMRKAKSCPSGFTFERRNNRQPENPSIIGNTNNIVEIQQIPNSPQLLNNSCSSTHGNQQTFHSNTHKQFSQFSNCNGIFDPELERRMQERLQMIAQPGQYQQAMFLRCGPPNYPGRWMYNYRH